MHSSTVTVRAPAEALIISALSDRSALLLHRLAELHARLGAGQFPEGADRFDRLHLSARGWTSGFWPGALWEASALVGGAGGRMFEDWALRATVAHLGLERSDTHDVGFMYGESSLLAWEALCSSGQSEHVCGRLRASVLAAANELRALAATNRRAGTVPTTDRTTRADTIIDSMMNVLILPWATAVTRDPAYSRLALRHASRVASLLVRPDGSTAQAVYFNRRTGRVLRVATHQGISASSTWSRGQGWALYGFSVLASSLRDTGLLQVALRLAGYVARRLPANGIPLWDYNARPGAPVDVSAGVITAAGLFHLAAACASLPGVCRDPSVWTALGERMLTAALGRASARPPLGYLGGQVLDEHRRGCWCNGGELILGLTYGLEAVALEHNPQLTRR